MATATEMNPPPYLAFKTFQSAIQGLRAHGLPSELDRTAWNTKSGTDQSQIIGALKFLGLIDTKGNTQQSLRDLVAAAENSPEEKKVLDGILRSFYSNVFLLDLQNATPKQLDAAIGDYGVAGALKTRAIRFFLKAARHVGIQLSTRLTMNLRDREPGESTNGEESANGEGVRPPSETPRRKRRQKVTPQVQPPPPPAGTPGVQGSNAMKTIQLPGVSGILTISGTFNPFELMGEERDLVYKIIDMMSVFQKSSKGVSE